MHLSLIAISVLFNFSCVLILFVCQSRERSGVELQTCAMRWSQGRSGIEQTSRERSGLNGIELAKLYLPVLAFTDVQCDCNFFSHNIIDCNYCCCILRRLSYLLPSLVCCFLSERTKLRLFHGCSAGKQHVREGNKNKTKQNSHKTIIAIDYLTVISKRRTL